MVYDPALHAANSPSRADAVGSIVAVEEADPTNLGSSMTFTYFQAWAGRQAQGDLDAANPDNLAIGPDGTVWFGTDGNFSRNGTADAVYYLDLDPSHMAGQPGITAPTYGEAFRVAAAPSDAEATGPTFNANSATLFFCVQHPGERQPSNWPPVR